jgi:hypothetical protein
MQDKTTIGISDLLRQFIEALVEEVVLEGKPFDDQKKKYLQRYSQEEGVNYETIESNLNDLFEAIKELEEHESKTTEQFVKNLAQSCNFSETEADKLINNAAARRAQKAVEAEEGENETSEKVTLTEKDAEDETERNRQQLVEKNRVPVKIILRSLAVISIVEIILFKWWCIFPLLFNAYFGMSVSEKCGQGEVDYEDLIFKGGVWVVILFFNSFLHWWGLLVILPIIYFIIIGEGKDIWGF